MEVNFLKIMTKYTIILILCMFLKAISVVELSNTNFKLEFEEVDVVNNDITYKKPEFSSVTLNNYIDKYMNENACTYLDYDVYDVGNYTVNIFLNCGNPQNIVYNYYKGIEVPFSELVKDAETFKNNITYLLNLKYPKFLVDEIEIFEGKYDIKENELTGYFKTDTFGDVNIKINNNEIRDLMKYEMEYDEVYENEVYTLNPNKKTIAFTFDDGPSNYDLEIMDYLKANHSSATFFIVGNRVNNFKSVITKMDELNMEVGNHTYSHKVMTKLSDSSIINEITRANTAYKNITGKDLKIFRAPYGSISSRVLLQTGLPSFLWSIDTLDWQHRNSQKIYNSIINDKLKDGDIILMHSLYASTVEGVKLVLPELYRRGYQVVSVGELFALKNKTMEIGKTYTTVR